MTTDLYSLSKRFQIYEYGLCKIHYNELDDNTQQQYIYIVPYSVPAHQIYKCSVKNCNEYIKHKDQGKLFFVNGMTPSPYR
jgi:hypothetical protein